MRVLVVEPERRLEVKEIATILEDGLTEDGEETGPGFGRIICVSVIRHNRAIA